MKRRIIAGFLALLLCLFVSVPSFASVASASEIGVSNDSVHNDISSLDDSSVSGVGMGDDAASSDEATNNVTLEDDSLDSGLDDTDTSSASGSVDAPVVPTWQEAVDDVKAQRAVASASEVDLMTMDLTDDDYGIMPLSSVGTVTNTVDRTGVSLFYEYTTYDGINKTARSYLKSDGSFRLDFEGYLNYFNFDFSSVALPPAGNYTFSYDLSSDFSVDYNRITLKFRKAINNSIVQNVSLNITSDCILSSGDVYFSSCNATLGNYGSSVTNAFVIENSITRNMIRDVFSGSVRFRFVPYTGNDLDLVSPGSSDTDIQADYQSNVTSGLSNIGDTLEEIVETISLQLEALWNQMYNYIHVPELNKLEEIRQAIENLDLNIDVDQSELISKLEEQIQNDNANTQHVTNGYDKSTLDDTNTQLSDTFQAQEDQEQDIMEQISHPLDDFEFNNPITQYLSTFLLFGDFLQSLFVSSGAMADVINFSFVITIALMVVGLYRFKGGN